MKWGKGLFQKLKNRLATTHKSIIEKAENLLRRYGKIDDDLLEELEEALIGADVGVETSVGLVEELRDEAKKAEKLDQE